MKEKIYNLLIIDESGSMVAIKEETIASVNEVIQTMIASEKKHPDQEHYVTVISFNDDVNTICECVPVRYAQQLTDKIYQPDCCTALYDAMGMSISRLRARVNEGDKVLVTVVTDGYENASKEYDGSAIKALVEELKPQGWAFAYIGANQDVTEVATTISITNTLEFEATPAGTREMSRRFSGFSSMVHSMMEEGENYYDSGKNLFDDI